MKQRIGMFASANLLFFLLTGAMVYAAPAEVPKSGQTIVYSDGDAGSMQTGAAWPSPRFTVASSGSGTVVTDELTGLMWMQNGGTPTVGACTGGAMSWSGGLAYVACLNANSYLGHDDWRFSNLSELLSLVNESQSNVSAWLNTQGFSNVQGLYYWSSSRDINYGGVWSVDMNLGYVQANNTSDIRYVWPVRDGQYGAINLPKTGQTMVFETGDDGDLQRGIVWPSPRFTPLSAVSGTVVVDQLTGLVWTRDADAPGPGACVPGVEKTWQGALDYVACLNTNSYLGYNDWRLPNRNELHSIVPCGSVVVSGWLNGQGFSGVEPYYYWSSSTSAKDTANAWYIYMRYGYMYVGMKSDAFHVWPVRGGQSESFAYLTISKSGTGTGAVTVDKGAVIWSGATGTASYGTAMTVNLAAPSDSGSVFTGWSGDAECSAGQVTMESDKVCIANFDVALPIARVSPASLSYNDQLINTISVVKKVTVRNTGNAPLFFTGISKGGMNRSQFSEVTTCPIGGEGLAAGASCMIKVKFKPTTAGVKSASVAINVEAPAESETVTLTGTGLGPIATVSPASLSYGEQTINTISLPKAVMVRNTGNLPLVITGIGKSGNNAGQFSQTNTCPIGGGGLAVGASCTIKVKFKPTTAGAKSASLAINFESPAGSRTVTLTGTGLP